MRSEGVTRDCGHDPIEPATCATCRADARAGLGDDGWQARNAYLPIGDLLVEEARSPWSGMQLGTAPLLLTHLALPYRNPAPALNGLPWHRVNGNWALSLKPAEFDIGRPTYRVAYPFGMYPRLLLLWLTTHAIVERSRHIDLGKTLNEFLRNLGISPNAGGNARKLVVRQFDALVMSQLIISDQSRPQMRLGRDVSVAQEWSIWANDADGHRPRDGHIVLSQPFYEEAVEKGRPIRLDHLAAFARLGHSPLALDVYVWLSHRLLTVSDATTVPWHLLVQQFGLVSAETFKVRQLFKTALARVGAVWPHFAVEVGRDGLILRPSSLPVPPDSPSEELKAWREQQRQLRQVRGRQPHSDAEPLF